MSPKKVSFHFVHDSSVANVLAIRLTALSPSRPLLPDPSLSSPLGTALPSLMLFPQMFAPAVVSIFAPRRHITFRGAEEGYGE